MAELDAEMCTVQVFSPRRYLNPGHARAQAAQEGAAILAHQRLGPIRCVTLLGQLGAPPIASGCDLLAHDGSGLLPSLVGEFAERRPVAEIAPDLLETLVRALPHRGPLAFVTGPVGSRK